MNKKILVVSILAIFMLVTISFASAITTNTTSTKKKESPLYRIRTRLAIGERILQIFKNIISRFIGERIFFLPNLLLKNKENSAFSTIFEKYTCFPSNYCTTYLTDTVGCPTCQR